MEKATFALGCFWGPDDFFSKLKGVIITRVGYSGGSKKNPNYEDLGDHTETVEITFDPDVISYQELLEHFWKQHDATEVQTVQYRSVIFYHNEKQKKSAERSLKEQQKKAKMIVTSIEEASTFYQAEEYHQKYLQKKSKSFF